MATKSLTLKEVKGITAGTAFTVNAFASDKTVTAYALFYGIDDAVNYTKFTPKIGSVKVGGQNWLSTEIIKITYEMIIADNSGTYSSLTDYGFSSASHQVSEKDGTVPSSVSISGDVTIKPSGTKTNIGFIFTIESTQNLVGCKVVMSDFQLTAEYTPVKYNAMVQSEDNNKGTVTPEGTASYSYGSKVEVKATPKEGYAFKKWTCWLSYEDTPTTSNSNPATFTIVGPCTITAYFDYVGVNKIYVGTSKPKDIYIGTSKVKGVYIGTTKVYG